MSTAIGPNMFERGRIAIRTMLIVLVCLTVFGGIKYIQSKGSVTIDSGFRPVMGTFVHIIAVTGDSETAQKSIKAAFNQIVHIDKLMSDYKPDSELSTVNKKAFKNPVTISDSLFEVLSRSIEFSKKTDGAFDITVGPLVDLYHKAGEQGVAPTEDEIAAAKAKAGFAKLILDEQNKTVKFAVDGMRLDLGGIGKGYAVDKAVEAMRNCGALGGLVALAGDIRVFGSPPKDKNSWMVGVQDPDKLSDSMENAQTVFVLHLKDMAVSTSGDYRRFTVIAGEKYNHIIDSKAGTGSRNFASVTVIAPSATDADALATAVSVMGVERGLELIKSVPQADAILIPSQNHQKIIKTEGVGKYLQ